MSTTNSSTGAEAHKPSTPTVYTFDFCNNTELKGVKKVVVRGQMRGLSPFQRAKLLSNEGRVCIAYRHGEQLMVLKENVNPAILYHYCPQLRNLYTCCKEAGPAIILPNTGDFKLVSKLGVEWVVGSFVHEVAIGTRSYVKHYIPLHADPKQLFHAAATFRAFDLARFAEDLVAPDNGVIIHYLRKTARNIESLRAVGKWVRSLKEDSLICRADKALLAEADNIFSRRTEGYNRKKAESSG